MIRQNSRHASLSARPPCGGSLLRNELLCYSWNNVNNSTPASLMKCITDFYSPMEIALARETLWDQCGEVLQSMKAKKVRRTAAPVDSQTAAPFAEDISLWMGMLANYTGDDKLIPQFYAIDLHNVPLCPPEHGNIFSLIVRVTELEKKMEDMDKQDACKVSKGGDNPTQTATPSVGARSHAPSSNVSSSQSGGSTSRMESQPPHPAESWTDVVKRKRNRAKRDIKAAAKTLPKVVGAADDTTLKGSEPVKHVFVRRLDGSCTTDDLRDYIRKKGVQPRVVHPTFKKDWNCASFKVTVPKSQFDALFSPAFWPCGVQCREWLPFVPKGNKDRSNPEVNLVDAGGDDDDNGSDGGGDDDTPEGPNTSNNSNGPYD